VKVVFRNLSPVKTWPSAGEKGTGAASFGTEVVVGIGILVGKVVGGVVGSVVGGVVAVVVGTGAGRVVGNVTGPVVTGGAGRVVATGRRASVVSTETFKPPSTWMDFDHDW
jgi:hypothetical protein